MKRLTLLTILLVVVGLTAGFAIEPTISLSGSGTLAWGIDLDGMTTGFKNTATASTTLTIAGAAGAKAGKDGWYGSISITAPSWAATDTGVLAFTAPATTATIVGMGGKAVIGVSKAPDTGDYTDFVAAIEADTAGTDAFFEDETNDVDTSYGLYGTYLSYTVSDALMVGLEVVSENDWNLNTNNAYAFALDVKATFAPLTIKAGANMGVLYAANPIGFGLQVIAALAPITATVGFDGQINGAVFAWEVGAGVDAVLMETVKVGLKVLYGDAFNDLDVMISFAEPLPAGLVDKMEAGLTVYLLDIVGSTLEYKAALTAGYDTGKLYPHVGVTYTDDSVLDATLTAFVHVNYDLFETAATVLFVTWDSGDLLVATPVIGDVTVGVTVTY